jgi:hypothetical protein
METRMRTRTLRWALALLSGIAMAGTVQAQPADSLLRVEYDSLGLAADAEPVPHRRLPDMGRCGVVGNAVVTDSAGLRRLRRYPQCADVAFPAPEGRTLVGITIMGDCHTAYRLHAFRSESRREYRIRVQTRYGGCRAGGFADAWLELPRLPAGWSVTVGREEVEGDVDLLGGDGWTSIRGR